MIALRRPGRHPRQMRGVGLIEVMVVVLLVSIGFLAAAALFARSLASNTSSMTRSLVVIQGASILDAMRADLNAARQGAYNTTVVGNACPSPGTSLASQQIHTWCTRLAAAAGSSAQTQGAIVCSASGDCTITVQFDDSRAGPGGSDRQTSIIRGML